MKMILVHYIILRKILLIFIEGSNPSLPNLQPLPKVLPSVFQEYKTLDTVKDAYTYLIQEKFDRKDLLIALGGGVVGVSCSL